MDSTPEFPHVALSPGERSPDIESSSQDQSAPEEQCKTEEPHEEGSPVETMEQSTGPGTLSESPDQGAQQQEIVTRESDGTAGEVSKGQEVLPLPKEESAKESEKRRDERSAPGNQEVCGDDSVMQGADLSSKYENKIDLSSQGQSEETAPGDKDEETPGDVVRQGNGDGNQDEFEQEEMDTTDGDQKPTEDGQVGSTGPPEVRDVNEVASQETTVTPEDQPVDKHEFAALTEMPARLQTHETDKDKTNEEGGQVTDESASSKENLDSHQKETGNVESSKESIPLGGSTVNVVADLISKSLVSEFSQEETKKDDPLQEKQDPDKIVDAAEVMSDADVAAAESAEKDSKYAEDEQEPEIMDTQILESEDGNTRDSMADPGTKNNRDDSNIDKVPKIFDECSMESFVSAKSSELDYRDSLQGSPLPVKRVRELICESPKASPKRSRTSTPTVQSGDDLGQFPAENVFEYQWPQDNPGEWYFVQEQISEFLGVKSFKRKYPNLERRVMDIKEKEFLRERGVVTEEQVTLGLTALRGDEVYDLMMKDYTNRYTEYARVIQEKQRQNISNQHKGYEAPTMDASKIKAYIKKAAKQAAEFNALLMREKREERQYYFDLQTMQLHMPQAKMKKLSKEDTKIGAYPVAVIPGQYQDYCRYYSADELNYLPLNTAIYGPMAIRRKTDYGPEVEEEEGDDDLDIMAEFTKNDEKDKVKSRLFTNQPQNDQQQRQQQEQRLQQLLNQPVQHQQQKQHPQRQQPRQQQQQPPQQQQQQQQPPPASSTPATSRSPSSAPTILRPRAGPIVVQPGPESGGSGDSDMVRLPGPEALQQSMEAVVPTPPRPYQPKIKPTAICGLCLKDRRSNTKGVPENLVHCSQCDNSGHPSCLEMNDELVATIKTYPWQCMECKTCSQCGDPTHEDKMMFCDKCDRGYHTFCVGLTDIPTGNWLCPTCSAGGLPPPVPPPPPSNLTRGLPLIQLQPGATYLPQQMMQGPPQPLQPSLPLLQGVPPQQQGVPPQPQAVPIQQQGMPPQPQGLLPHPGHALPQQGLTPQQHGLQPGLQSQQQSLPPRQQGIPP